MDPRAQPIERSTPLVSVIISTYMRASLIGRCLESLSAQTFKDFEILVCDDGSTDDTAAMVERYRGTLNLHYHWDKNFGGPARPRNAGLRLARGTYVAFLDVDDWWASRKLERSVRALDAGADVVYHDLYIARSPGGGWRPRRARTRRLALPAFESLIERGNVLTNSSVVVRRSLLLDIGGLSEDPTLIAWEDYDCWLRLAKLTDKFERLPEPLGWYWVGGGNLTSPRRTIRNLERMRTMYLCGNGRGGNEDLPAWYHYGMGRAHYHLCEYAAARRHMTRAVRGWLSPGVRTIALMTLGQCLILGCVSGTRASISKRL
jgi:glycosyltransferase involved in cell wall biosynthesis